MTKQISSKSMRHAKGGSTRMFSKTGVAAQLPGVTSVTRAIGPAKAHGGSTRMAGKQTVKPVRAS